ncbi:MAG: hypothetical protein OHK0038_25480 [Flammeovirgaceae bacterium]
MKIRSVLFLVSSIAIFAFWGSKLFAMSGGKVNGKRWGEVKKEERKVQGSFSGVVVKSGIDIFFSIGNEEKVTVEADEKALDKIITEVRGNDLYVYVDGNLRNVNVMKVYITAKILENVDCSSGSDFYLETPLKSEKLRLRIRSGSDFNGEKGVETVSLDLDASSGSDTRINLTTKSLLVDISSGSDVMITGSAESLDLNASGGSDFKGRDLKAGNCKINASGASDVNIFATGEVEIEASGASDISLKGSPSVRRQKVSGAANVEID